MKVFVTGVNGQLGYDMAQELAGRHHTVIGSDITPAYAGRLAYNPKAAYISMDITNQQQVEQVFSQVRPDAIVHCAAWTAVDAAEEPENLDKVMAINVSGTEYITQMAQKLDAWLLYLSTDYIFDGQGETPWQPDETDYAPLNVYGKSKLAGEKAVLQWPKSAIVRIAWVFGPNGNNFVKTMLKLSQTHPMLRVVNDQIGLPTYTPDLAVLLGDMLEKEICGIYHATNTGAFISWYDFACEIFRQAGINEEVIPVTTQEYGLSKAARPYNSRLALDKLTENSLDQLPDWKSALHRYLTFLKEDASWDKSR